MSFLCIAHRGASGTRPEHTRSALERAIEIGVDMIEIDVQLTRDQQLVVLHDRELGRTIAGTGAVRDHDLADLCRRDAGAWFAPEYAGQRVLSLAEVLEITSGRVPLNIEIKSPEPDWEKTAVELLALLVRFDQLGVTIVSSFEMGALRRVRAAAPAARLGVLWQRADLESAWNHARELDAATVHLHWALAGDAAVSEASRRGLSVLAWTVNDIDIMSRLAQGGVAGIISDFPERFAGVPGLPPP
jgi:glycerophosphoryl diester phosphodiesterase